MVSFSCESCGDIVKKPALVKHSRQCRANTFTCVDCNHTFHGDYAGHVECISEAEKYQKGLYKGKKKGKHTAATDLQSPPTLPSAPAPAAIEEEQNVPHQSNEASQPATDSKEPSHAVSDSSEKNKKKKRKRESKIEQLGPAAVTANGIQAITDVAQVEDTKISKKLKKGTPSDALPDLPASIAASVRAIFAVHGVTKTIKETIDLVTADLRITLPSIDRVQVEEAMLAHLRFQTGKKRPQLVLP